MGYTPVTIHKPQAETAHNAASSSGRPPPPAGGFGKIALSAQTAATRPTMSVEQQRQINELRVEAEMDRLRYESAHNYTMAKAGAQVAEMLSKQHMQTPQHNYNVFINGAPNISPAPQPMPVFMKDNTAELRRILELEMRNTTLHDESMRQGASFKQTVDKLKGENAMAHERAELAWNGQLKSELRANQLEGAMQVAAVAGAERGRERERSPKARIRRNKPVIEAGVGGGGGPPPPPPPGAGAVAVAEEAQKGQKSKAEVATPSSQKKKREESPPPLPPPAEPPSDDERPHIRRAAHTLDRGQGIRRAAHDPLDSAQKKKRDEIFHPPPAPTDPIIIPINNPVQKEPPRQNTGAPPVTGAAALPNPPPPPEPEPPSLVEVTAARKGKKKSKGKNKKQDNDKPLTHGRGFGSIAEQPVETHTISTPPKEEQKGARKKRQSRTGDDSLKLLQRTYRAKRTPRRAAGDVVRQAEQMLAGKAHSHKKPGDFSKGKRKNDRPQRDAADEFVRIQGRQRGIDITDMLGPGM